MEPNRKLILYVNELIKGTPYEFRKSLIFHKADLHKLWKLKEKKEH